MVKVLGFVFKIKEYLESFNNISKFLSIWGIPIIIFTGNFFFKFHNIEFRDIALDEPFTIFHSQQSLEHIITLPSQNEPHPPLHNILMHFTIKWFGYSPTALRFLSLLFSCIIAVLLFLIGKKLHSQRAGILASIFFSLSSQHYYFALEARSYGLFNMLSIFSIYYYIQEFERDKKKLNWGLLVVNLLLVYTHYFGWLVIFTQFILGYIFLSKKSIKYLLYSILIIFLVYTPMWMILYKQFLISRNKPIISSFGFRYYTDHISFFFNGKDNFSELIVLPVLVIIASLLYKRYTFFKKHHLLFFLWFSIPYSIMYLLSFKIPLFVDRYILFNSLPLYLLFSFLVIYVKQYKLISVTLICYCFFLMYNNISINSKHYCYRQIKRGVEKVKIQKKEFPNSKIFINPEWAANAFTYYYDIELFKKYDNFERNLNERNIYTNINNIDTNTSYLILFDDESPKNHNSGSKFRLSEDYDLIDSAFYEECTKVYTFKLR